MPLSSPSSLRSPWPCLIAWAASLALAGVGAAQQGQSPQEPMPRLQGYPHEHAGEGGGSLWARDHLTGDWYGWRSWLREHGITPELFSTSDASLVFAGGVDTGGFALRTLVDATFAFASEPLLGYRGGTLFVDLQLQRGDDGSLDTGDLQRYSDIDHDHEFEELAMLWYEQSFDDTLFVRIGKDDSNTSFQALGAVDHSVHPSFGHSPTILALPTYPDTAWGVQAFYRPQGWYLGAGVYDGALQSGVRTGERGPRTWFGAPADLFAIGEVGVDWQGARPGRAGVGAWRATGAFQRFDGSTDDGTAGCYALAEQAVWRDGDGADARELAFYAMCGWCDERVSPFAHHVGAGARWRGPFAVRPHDALGFGATYAAFSDANGAGLRGGGELAIEAFYELKLAPWLAVKPVLTWIDDPGGVPGVEDAWVFTVRTAITF